MRPAAPLLPILLALTPLSAPAQARQAVLPGPTATHPIHAPTMLPAQAGAMPRTGPGDPAFQSGLLQPREGREVPAMLLPLPPGVDAGPVPLLPPVPECSERTPCPLALPARAVPGSDARPDAEWHPSRGWWMLGLALPLLGLARAARQGSTGVRLG